MNWHGHATERGTRDYLSRFDGGLRVLGRSGLVCGAVGIGTYRTNDVSAEQHQAMRVALISGCNLVDTSNSYQDGRSESAVCDVLSELREEGLLLREQVIVISKIGLTSRARALAAMADSPDKRSYLELPDMGTPVSCVHPNWLALQLAESRRRLGLQTLDVCLLEEPVVCQRDPAQNAELDDHERRREELYNALEHAFRFLENEVAAGRLCYYGVASEALSSPSHETRSLSLGRFLEVAHAAGGPDHHCRFVEVPLNLLEGSAGRTSGGNADGLGGLLQVAAGANVAVLTCRPLEARGNGVRLADRALPTQNVPFGRQLQTVAQLEERFRRSYLGISASEKEESIGGVHLSPAFETLPANLNGPRDWDLLEPRIWHLIAHELRRVQRCVPPPCLPEWHAWCAEYRYAIRVLFHEIGRLAILRAQARLEAVRSELDDAVPSKRREEPLSRKALWVVLSTPGISCVLTGMRRLSYVRDAVAVRGWPPLEDTDAVYEAMGRLFRSEKWRVMSGPVYT